MNEQTHDSTDHFRLDITEANNRISRWQNENYILVPNRFTGSIPPGHTPLKLDSFSLSVEDLLHLTERIKAYNISESGKDNYPISGFSCRLGIKDYTNEKGNQEPLPCLLMEPLIGFERNDDPNNPIPINAGQRVDQIFNDGIPEVGVQVEALNYSAFYDFSYPCPPTCPVR